MYTTAVRSLLCFFRLREYLWSLCVGDDTSRPVALRKTVLVFCREGADDVAAKATSETYLPSYVLGPRLGAWISSCIDGIRAKRLQRRIAVPIGGGRLPPAAVELLECSSHGKIVVITRLPSERRVDASNKQEWNAATHEKVATVSSVWSNGAVAPRGLHQFVDRYVGFLPIRPEEDGEEERGIDRDLALGIAYVMGFLDRDPQLVFSLIAQPHREDRLVVAQVLGCVFRDVTVGAHQPVLRSVS